MSQIHITDGITDRILDVVTAQYIIEDVHKQSLEDTLETFDFTTFADKRFSGYLEKRNRLIIPDEDGEYREFIIEESIKDMSRRTEVYATASYLELKKQAVIYPQTFNEQTATQMVSHATNNTEWVPGTVEIDNYRTFVVENHTNPYAFLKTIANEFDAELRFRVETDGNKVTRRYVDLLERRGIWRGREVTFGKDLAGIKRTEMTDNVYTALVGIGPEREDGTRLEVTVEDEDALQRWGRRDPQTGELQHLIGTYEPQSTREDMTEDELRQYTRTELNKRINEVVKYEADIVDLEHVPGIENKKIRFGDTIKIKDTKFNPALYLEARVFEQERSIVDKSRKKIKLGDYTEFTEEEVTAIWQQLQNQIQDKLDAAEMREYTYDKLTIDDKDTTVFEEGKTFAELQAGNAQTAAEQHADTVANEAEQNAKDYADDAAGQALIDAQNYAVAKEVYDNKMEEIANNLSDKAGIEYVDGQLQLKQGSIPQQSTAPSSPSTGMLWLDTSQTPNVMKRYDGSDWVKASPTDASEVGSYTIAEVDNRLSNKVSVTQYESDMDGVISDIQSNSTLIGQNEDAIALKADASRVDTLEGTVSDHSAELVVMNNEISQKVEADYVQGEIDKLQVGGRNLIRNSDFSNGMEHYNTWNVDEYEIVSDKKYGNVLYVVTSDNSNYVANRDVSEYIKSDLKEGEKVTVSFTAKGTADLRRIRLGGYGPSATRITSNGDIREITEEWGHYSVTLDVTSDTSDVADLWGLRFAVASGEIYISNLKLEKGNKATDWTPAPEDTQSQIDDLDVTVSSHSTEIQQNATAITQKAESSELDTLTGRVSTAESEIQQQADEIEQRVTDDEARSIFTQEADSFTFDADQINFDGHVFGEDATFSGLVEGGRVITWDDSNNIRTFMGEGSIENTNYGTGDHVDIEEGKIKLGTLKDNGDVFTKDLEIARDRIESFTGSLHLGSARYIYVGNVVRSTGDYDLRLGSPNLNTDVTGDSLHLMTNNKVNVTSTDAYDVYRPLVAESFELPNASGTSGTLRISDRHLISEYNGGLVIYGNADEGEPFKVRAHDNFNNYRNIIWIDGLDRTNFSGSILSEATADNTTSNSPNVHIFSGTGRFVRSTSARKYKMDIRPADVDYNKILDLEPKSWYDISEFKDNGSSTEGLSRHYGAIANDFDDLGLEQYLVLNDKTGEIENFNDRVWTLLIPVIRDLKQYTEDEINWLKMENEYLKSRIAKLEGDNNVSRY